MTTKRFKLCLGLTAIWGVTLLIPNRIVDASDDSIPLEPLPSGMCLPGDVYLRRTVKPTLGFVYRGWPYYCRNSQWHAFGSDAPLTNAGDSQIIRTSPSKGETFADSASHCYNVGYRANALECYPLDSGYVVRLKMPPPTSPKSESGSSK